MSEPIKMTRAEWTAEGYRRFGSDVAAWRFVCPCCGHVASVADWKAAGATDGEIAFSCIGRRVGPAREAFGEGVGPCDYAGGGLFRLNPVHVAYGERTVEVFDFAGPVEVKL